MKSIPTYRFVKLKNIRDKYFKEREKYLERNIYFERKIDPLYQSWIVKFCIFRMHFSRSMFNYAIKI